MTAGEVKELIPEKYFQATKSAETLNCLVDVAFRPEGIPVYALLYYCTDGPFDEYSAGAVLYFDASNRLLGFSYGGSSSPLINSNKSSKGGPAIKLGESKQRGTQPPPPN